MPEIVAHLSASRAYEFAQDRIRLTVLTLPDVVTALRETFRFEVAGVGSPPNTFGPVFPTLPSGVVFQLGVLQGETGPNQYIRELYIEPRRIVISTAGPSETINQVWLRLNKILEQFVRLHGVIISGEPENVRDHSEITVRLRINPQALVAPALVAASEKTVTIKPSKQTRVFVPAIHSIMWPEETDYPGDYPGELIGPRNVWTLSVRAGTKVASGQEFFSGAPLESGKHIAYLEEIETALASDDAP